eukprot:SAG31_NODE_397_length_16251_cov_7.922486_5_plen_55_part_00
MPVEERRRGKNTGRFCHPKHNDFRAKYLQRAHAVRESANDEEPRVKMVLRAERI